MEDKINNPLVIVQIQEHNLLPQESQGKTVEKQIRGNKDTKW